MHFDWYGMLFEESLLPAWICDAETMAILQVNRRAVEHYGYSRDEFLRMQVTDLLLPEDIPALMDASSQAGGHFDRGMWKHRTKSGEFITVDVCSHRFFADGRRALHMIVHDPPRPMFDPPHNVKEFRDAEERFRVIADHLDTVFWISRPNQGEILYLSPAFERIWGASRDEIYRNPQAWIDYVHPEDREELQREILQRRETKPLRPDEQVYRIVRPDGQVRWIRARMLPVFSGEGVLDRVVGMAEDITAQMDAEEVAARRENELQESETRHRTLFEQSLAGIYRSTLDGTIIDCNEAFATILGYESREVLIGRQAHGLYDSPGDRQQFLEQLKQEGKLASYELRLRRRDGSHVWILENVAMIDGTIIQGTLLDVTDRRQLEAELRNNEELLRRIIDSSNDIIVMQDCEGRYLYTKPSPAYGIVPEAMKGKTPFDFLEPGDAETTMRHLREVVSSGQPNSSEDQIAWRGERLWFQTQRSPVFGDGGAVVAVVTFSRNITEQKRAEAEIQESRERIKLQDLRMKIAADLHDDIGSTLSSTSIFSAMLRGSLPSGNDRAAGLLDRIDEHLRNAQESLHDIVWSINPENDRLESLLLHMQEYAAEVMEARGIALHLDVMEVRNDVRIPMNSRRNLYLMFKEAVTNAVRHSACTEASVEIRTDEELLRVMVKDNGRGFLPSDGHRGNGLSNMRARARAVGGELTITSQPGRGTSVVLLLPIA